MKRGKRYQEKLQLLDRRIAYPLDEALGKLKEMSAAKFDETVEMAMKLGIDPRKSDQIVRGAMVLPRGTGQTVRVAVVAEGEPAAAAEEAGADTVGADDLIEKIENGWLDFDVLIATPDSMKSLRKLGRVLGPRGLMPNPKTGTVTEDTGQAVKEAKAGRVEFRSDRSGCLHVPVGKKSFDGDALKENITAVVHTVTQNRPATLKGTYMKSAAVSATMSPGVKIDVNDLTKV